ncbi:MULTISPECIES: hypothetical protein [Cupriavidus]|uniref:hypothetical protein n=1 Tax=Cupriavidus neocaledonicus TaxID=1040979 RepID=UPI0023F6375B|nr:MULTISPECIES: hypothetical protein [Cupriavidus]
MMLFVGMALGVVVSCLLAAVVVFRVRVALGLRMVAMAVPMFVRATAGLAARQQYASGCQRTNDDDCRDDGLLLGSN